MAAKGRKNKGKKEEVEEENETNENTETTETSSGPAHEPHVVHYCPHCRYPVEYCEFSNCFEEKCLPHLQEKFPELAEKLVELRGSDKHKDKNVKSVKAEKAPKIVGGEVFLKIKQRSARKYETIISGLENYGVDLEAVAKQFKKRFACGTSVSYDPVPELEIQGDVKRDIHPIMLNEWKIPNENIYTEYKKTLEDGTTEKKKVLLSEFLKLPDQRDRKTKGQR